LYITIDESARDLDTFPVTIRHSQERRIDSGTFRYYFKIYRNTFPEEDKMYKKALVPLDGSQLAECALSHVKKLAQDGAVGKVILLNVVDVKLPPAYLNPDFDLRQLVDVQLDKSRKYLAQVKARLKEISVETEIMEGTDIAQDIVDYATKQRVDLIVLGTHGYTGMRKLMFGSVALRVLHDAHVPVLLIRPEACQV
jgi:nucleotide-binding universal stress UspA family protein